MILDKKRGEKKMIDNTISVQGDGHSTDIYLNRISELTDEYINGLDDTEEIYKAPVFMGLLKSLYISLFRPSKTMRHNSNSVLVDAEPETISELWDIFAGICYKYRNTPTILKFCTMTGLDRVTFERWKNGESRNANPAYCRTAQKAYTESESALESKAIESNGIGAIFGLKSCFQWRETSPLAAEISPAIQHETAEQIAARYASAALPERPDLSEFD